MQFPVDDHDSDLEIRQMIEESEEDIKYGRIYSIDEMIEDIIREA